MIRPKVAKLQILSPIEINKWSLRRVAFARNEDDYAFIGGLSLPSFYNYLFINKYVGSITSPSLFEDNFDIDEEVVQFHKKGLFSELIFGPERSFACSCNKNFYYYDFLFKDCPFCGVSKTFFEIRRYRMGQINLSLPVFHPWVVKFPSDFIYTLFKQKGIRNKLFLNEFDIYQERMLSKKEYGPKLNKNKINTNDNLLENFSTNLCEVVEKLNKIKDKNKIKFTKIRSLLKNIFKLKLKDWRILLYTEIKENFDLLKEKKKLKEKISYKMKSNQTFDYLLCLRQLRLLEGLDKNNIDISWLFITKVPVVSPDFRGEIEKKNPRTLSVAGINRLYQKILNINKKFQYLLLKKINNPNINFLLSHQYNLLQETIIFLIDSSVISSATLINQRPQRSMISRLEGKMGRLRHDILGKRLNFSARAVIVPNPKLSINQCGIPFNILEGLFDLHIKTIISTMFQQKENNNFWTSIKNNKKLFFFIVNEYLKNKIVYLNRAPTLHRFSIQAFSPIIATSSAIELHPLVCAAYNADFDGDQMSLHIPLIPQSELELKLFIKINQNTFYSTNSTIILKPTQEQILGLYYLSLMKINSQFEIFLKDIYQLNAAICEKKILLQQPIWFKMAQTFVKTTPGRLFLQMLLK